MPTLSPVRPQTVPERDSPDYRPFIHRPSRRRPARDAKRAGEAFGPPTYRHQLFGMVSDAFGT
eukprot:3013469-Pyramimonas_sp.AAC.1